MRRRPVPSRKPSRSAITEQDPHDTFAVNLKDQFLMIQAIAPCMRARGAGKIVNVSAELALVGRAGLATYCTPEELAEVIWFLASPANSYDRTGRRAPTVVL